MLYDTVKTEVLTKQAAGGKSGLLKTLSLLGLGSAGTLAAPHAMSSIGDWYKDRFPDPTDEELYERNLPDLERARKEYNAQVDRQNRHLAKIDPKLEKEYYESSGVNAKAAELKKLRAKFNEYARVLKENGQEADVEEWMRLNGTDVNPTSPEMSTEDIAKYMNVAPYTSRQLQKIGPAGPASVRAIQQQANSPAATPPAIGGGGNKATSSAVPSLPEEPMNTADLLPYIGALGGAGIGALTGGEEYDEYGRKKKDSSRLFNSVVGGGLGLGAGMLAKNYLS